MSLFKKPYARVIASGTIELATESDIKPVWGYLRVEMDTNLDAYGSGYFKFKKLVGESYFTMDSYITSFGKGWFGNSFEEVQEKMDAYVQEVTEFLGSTGNVKIDYDCLSSVGKVPND